MPTPIGLSPSLSESWLIYRLSLLTADSKAVCWSRTDIRPQTGTPRADPIGERVGLRLVNEGWRVSAMNALVSMSSGGVGIAERDHLALVAGRAAAESGGAFLV